MFHNVNRRDGGSGYTLPTRHIGVSVALQLAHLCLAPTTVGGDLNTPARTLDDAASADTVGGGGWTRLLFKEDDEMLLDVVSAAV